MLNIKQSILNSKNMEYAIHYGPINFNGIQDDFALVYEPKNHIITYLINDNSSEFDSELINDTAFIYKFLYKKIIIVLAADINKNPYGTNDTIKYFNELPNTYRVCFKCKLSGIFWEIIHVFINSFNRSNEFSSFLYGEQNYDNMFKVIDYNNNLVSYPITLNGLYQNNETVDISARILNKELKTYLPKLRICDFNVIDATRYMTKYKNYTLKMYNVKGTHSVVIVVHKDNNIYTLKPIDALIGFYLAILDEDKFDEKDQMLFDILIDKLIILPNDSLIDDVSFPYSVIMGNFNYLLKKNDINFETLCDLLYNAIMLTSQTILDVCHEEGDMMFSEIGDITIVALFKYFIKDVTSFKSLPKFKLIK